MFNKKKEERLRFLECNVATITSTVHTFLQIVQFKWLWPIHAAITIVKYIGVETLTDFDWTQFLDSSGSMDE